MYRAESINNKRVRYKFRNIQIELALGCGYNPDECVTRKIAGLLLNKPYLLYEGTWYVVTCAWRWNQLTDIIDWLKKDVYSEEQFLEKLMELIA